MELVYEVTSAGQDLPALLPEGQEVELTVTMVSDSQITMSAFFPSLDHTIDIQVPTNTVQQAVEPTLLESDIRKAKQALDLIRQEGVYADTAELDQLDAELTDINKRLDQGRADDDRNKEVLDNLRRSLRKLDDIQDASEWPKTEAELKDVFYRLEDTNKNFGNAESTQLLEQFRGHIHQVISGRKVRLGQDLIESMRQLDFALVDEGLGAQMEITMLNQFNADFDTHDWSDRNKAKLLITQGLQMAGANPSKVQLRALVMELYKLLPTVQQPILSGDDSLLTD